MIVRAPIDAPAPIVTNGPIDTSAPSVASAAIDAQRIDAVRRRHRLMKQATACGEASDTDRRCAAPAQGAALWSPVAEDHRRRAGVASCAWYRGLATKVRSPGCRPARCRRRGRCRRRHRAFEAAVQPFSEVSQLQMRSKDNSLPMATAGIVAASSLLLRRAHRLDRARHLNAERRFPGLLPGADDQRRGRGHRLRQPLLEDRPDRREEPSRSTRRRNCPCRRSRPCRP